MMRYILVLLLFVSAPAYAEMAEAVPPGGVSSVSCGPDADCDDPDIQQHEEPAEPVMCTMDARVCPDGSYVSRTGPKCQFAPCPGEDENSSGLPSK